MELRLYGSKYEASGLVQVRHGPDDEWGFICGTTWDDRDMQVACRHLGFVRSIFVKQGMQDITPIPNTTFLSAVGCFGNESKLSQCELVSEVDRLCNGEYAYVECMAGTYVISVV